MMKYNRMIWHENLLATLVDKEILDSPTVHSTQMKWLWKEWVSMFI